MREAVIVGAVRTPVGGYMGTLREVPAYDLGALVLNEVVRRVGVDPGEVDEVVFGQSYQSGEYVNIARMSLLIAGWPERTAGITIDRRCCSGLEAICWATLMVRAGAADMVAAGGVESMSTAEFYLTGDVKWGVGGKRGMPRGHGQLASWGIPMFDRIQRARVMSQPEARYGVLPSMMSWAETAAKEEDITRAACDEWALASHRKACAAMQAGRFEEEILPMTIDQGKEGSIVFDKDEGPRADTSLEKLARLRPVMGGVCTAGNSSSENDGAAVVLVTTREKADKLGCRPLGRIAAHAVAGDDPRHTYRTVPAAVEAALKRADVSADRMELVEIQEAFAAQVLADLKFMGLGPDEYDKVNVNGSGISLGHPVGCTGARVLVTLLHEMKRRKARFGIESICGGGGLGIAAVVENINQP